MQNQEFIKTMKSKKLQINLDIDWLILIFFLSQFYFQHRILSLKNLNLINYLLKWFNQTNRLKLIWPVFSTNHKFYYN